MNEFKEGDRVRVNNPELRIAHGTTATILEKSGEFYVVIPDDNMTLRPGYFPGELEPE